MTEALKTPKNDMTSGLNHTYSVAVSNGDIFALQLRNRSFLIIDAACFHSITGELKPRMH